MMKYRGRERRERMNQLIHNNRYLPQTTTKINEEYKEEIKKKQVVEVLVVLLLSSGYPIQKTIH